MCLNYLERLCLYIYVVAKSVINDADADTHADADAAEDATYDIADANAPTHVGAHPLPLNVKC